MKDKQQKTFAGVWLDNQQAMIISPDEQGTYTVSGKVQATASQSGGSEHSMNNGKKTEHLKYFKEVSQELASYDEILIFGPGQAQEQLQRHLKEDGQFSNKHISIDSADQLTDPQMIAKVREFFKGRQS